MKNTKKVFSPSLLINLSVLLISTILVLLLGEAAARVLCTDLETKGMPNTRDQFEAELHSRIFMVSSIPNVDYEPVYNRTERAGYDSDYTSRPFSINKDKGTYRIVLIGDSHMQNANALYLEGRLKNATHSGVKAEVLNFGAGGYNLIRKKILLDEKIRYYQPDIIIVQLLDDDCDVQYVYSEAADMLVSNVSFIEVSHDVIIPYSIPLPDSLNRVLVKSSYLYRWISLRTYYAGIRFIPEAPRAKRMVRCENALLEIIGISRELNASTLFFLSHAVRYDFNDYPREYSEREFSMWIEQMDKEHNLSLITLFPYIRGYDYKDLKKDDDGHYNSIGYNITYRLLLEAITERHLLPVNEVTTQILKTSSNLVHTGE